MPSTLPVRVLNRFGRYGLGVLAFAKPASITWPGGVVSFTFDDFPRSALQTAGPVLDKHRVRATYYVALGLAGSETELGPMFEPEEVTLAHRDGHEIGCHTYGHVRIARMPSAAIFADLAANAALAELTGGNAPVSFAYPYGERSLRAERAVATRYLSCRGISRGINRGVVDLADLRANPIRARQYEATAFRRLIDEAVATNGWLVFYTHDVREAPSPHGCAPEQLQAIVSYAAQRTMVLPVRDVIARLDLAGTD